VVALLTDVSATAYGSTEPVDALRGKHGFRPAVANPFTAPAIAYEPPSPVNRSRPIGLIGCGSVSEYHLRAYQQAGFNVTSLCSRDISKADARRAEFFPAANIYDSVEEFLKSDDAEVVDILVPVRNRAAITRMALSCRRHVLSQKPFVSDLDIGRNLIDLAMKYDVRLAVNHNARWAPHFAYMLGAVRQGVIGEVMAAHFSIQWDHDWIAETRFNDLRHVILFDFGIHWFDIIACLMDGKSRQVYAMQLRTCLQRAREPLSAQVFLEFDNGQVSINFDGNTRFGAQDRSTIVGRDGCLTSVGPDLNDQIVTLSTAHGAARPELRGTWFTSGFEGSMAELLCAIDHGREPSNSAQSTLNGIAMAIAAVISAARRRPTCPRIARTLPL